MNKFSIQIELTDFNDPAAIRLFEALAGVENVPGQTLTLEAQPEKTAAKQMVDKVIKEQQAAEIKKETAAEKKARIAAEIAAEAVVEKDDNSGEDGDDAEVPTIVEIRALMSTKIENSRDKIKAKLTSLGAANVTTLEEDCYIEFYNFLKSL